MRISYQNQLLYKFRRSKNNIYLFSQAQSEASPVVRTISVEHYRHQYYQLVRVSKTPGLFHSHFREKWFPASHSAGP